MKENRPSDLIRSLAQLRKIERNLITVGDRVLCQPATDLEMPVETDLPRVMVINRAPREGKIARRDPINEALEHVIAANIDQLVIIASVLKPKVRWGLVDRYLALAEEQRLPVILVLNKVDLLHEADEAFKEKYGEMVAVYKNLGYEVLEISALSQKQQDFAPAGDLLKDKVSIFSGHSGVGKSSLVNQFDPEIVQEVEGNPDIFYKGRHTTTYASFIKLKSLGGYVIDTPGIRSLSVGDRSAIELTYSFRDLRPFMGRCKFRECRHIDEPECAVLEALDTGEVHPSRYASYRSLLLGESGREGRSGLKEEDDLQIEEFE